MVTGIAAECAKGVKTAIAIGQAGEKLLSKQSSVNDREYPRRHFIENGKLKVSLPELESGNNGRRIYTGEEKFMRRAISLLAACILMMVFASATLAQDSGRINGEILDKEGKPYPDVTVVLKNTATGQTYTLKTDKNGKFVQLGLKGGIYTITSTNAKDSFNFTEKFAVSLDHDNE